MDIESPDKLTAEVNPEPNDEPTAKPDVKMDADSETENKHAQARNNDGLTPAPSDKTEKNE